MFYWVLTYTMIVAAHNLVICFCSLAANPRIGLIYSLQRFPELGSCTMGCFWALRAIDHTYLFSWRVLFQSLFIINEPIISQVVHSIAGCPFSLRFYQLLVHVTLSYLGYPPTKTDPLCNFHYTNNKIDLLGCIVALEPDAWPSDTVMDHSFRQFKEIR